VFVCILPEKAVSKMTYAVSGGTLNPTHSLTHSMLKISHAGFLVYLQPFRRNSRFICALQSKIAKKSPKPSFWGFSRSRSSMLTNLKSTLLVLVVICSKSVLICNYFHIVKANNGKITFLGGTPLWRSRSKGTPSPRARNFVIKTRVLGAAHSKDFVILGVAVLIQC